jgi:hypothetical protein
VLQWFEVVPNCAKWFEVISTVSSRVFPSVFELSQVVREASHHLRTVPSDSECFEVVASVSGLSGLL